MIHGLAEHGTCTYTYENSTDDLLRSLAISRVRPGGVASQKPWQIIVYGYIFGCRISNNRF